MTEVRLYLVEVIDIVLLELVALYDAVDVALYRIAHLGVDLLGGVGVHCHVVGCVQRGDIHHGVDSEAVEMVLDELEVSVVGENILYRRPALEGLGHDTGVIDHHHLVHVLVPVGHHYQRGHDHQGREQDRRDDSGDYE